MLFTKKQAYVPLDHGDEEMKIETPIVKIVTVETSSRWVLATMILLVLSIITTCASIYQNWSQTSTSVPIISAPHVSLPTSFSSDESCVSPPIRREWRTLNTKAKKDYIKAVQCLATKPSKVGGHGSAYDDFPVIHQQTAPTAHIGASFFPWHRYFIHIYEKSLKDECSYQGVLPYWDWSADWKDFVNAPVWDSESGFGGNGNSSGEITVGEGRCVTDGPFAGLEALFYGENYDPHCLSRGFSSGAQLEKLSDLVRPDVVEDIMQNDEFNAFASALERNAHQFISGSIRGDFSSYTGPYDPVFFLHHTNLDRLWWQWQQENPDSRLLAYNGLSPKVASSPTVQLTDMLDVGALESAIAVKQVMETNKGIFCYQY